MEMAATYNQPQEVDKSVSGFIVSVGQAVGIVIAVLLVGGAAWWVLRARHRQARQRRLMSTPLPPEWVTIVEQNLPPYRSLSADERSQLHGFIQLFLAERTTTLEALAHAGIEPIRLAPKEGLALLNGTQVSTALALAAVFRCENVLAAALVAGAMSADAVKGSDTPFDRRIHSVRGHGGQTAVAGVLRPPRNSAATNSLSIQSQGSPAAWSAWKK